MKIKIAKKIIRKNLMTKSLEKRFLENGLKHRLLGEKGVYARTAELLEENKNANKALFAHLQKILPSIAFYEALLAETEHKETALKLYDQWAYDYLKKFAHFVKSISKLGLYKKMPVIFDKAIDKLFGQEAGFKSVNIPDLPIFSRDIIACPYFETCKKYGYPEITQFFCKSDDLTYGDIHPKLVFKLTKTIGRGNDCCDFRLWLKEN